MAVIKATNLTSGGDISTQETSTTTASISPRANTLIIVAVAQYNTGTPNTPTVTGASMTWTQIATRLSADGHQKITMFRALSSSPGTGALTIDYGGQNNYRHWDINQFSNVKTGGINGNNAVVQEKDNSTTGTSSGMTVTLNALNSSNNASYGIIRDDAASSIIAGAGFTEIINLNGVCESEWTINNASVNWTWSSRASNRVGMAIEIAAALGGIIVSDI